MLAFQGQKSIGADTTNTGASAPRLVVSSLVVFVSLARRRTLRLATGRLGCSYLLCDGRSYRVFRESVRPLSGQSRTVIEVGFRLKLVRSSPLAHWLFQRLCILTTPFWSGFEGFGTKLWMVDPLTHSYAGIYEWEGEDRARTYLRVLLPILRRLSVPGTVFSELHPDAELDRFLLARQSDT
jgi:hypothetical protein